MTSPRPLTPAEQAILRPHVERFAEIGRRIEILTAMRDEAQRGIALGVALLLGEPAPHVGVSLTTDGTIHLVTQEQDHASPP